MDTNMQFTIKSFRQLFPDKIFSLTISWFSVKSLTFPWQLSNSPTFFQVFQTRGHPEWRPKISSQLQYTIECIARNKNCRLYQYKCTKALQFRCTAGVYVYVQHEHKHQLTKLHCSVSEISLSKEKYSVAYLGFQTPRWWGAGDGSGEKKIHFYVPKIIILGAFWHVFWSLIGATTGCKTHFLCHTTYCECLKTITQPFRPTIQWIKLKISGNINFADNF